MFEDQMPKTSGQVPGNLPIGEPEDMFSSVDKAEPVVEKPVDRLSEVPPATPSALDAGILRPKITTMPDMSRVEEGLGIKKSQGVQSPQPGSGDIYAIKEPTLTRGLVTMIIIVVAILILGAGGWWIYNSFIRTPEENVFVVPPVDLNTPEEEVVFPAVDITEPTIEEPVVVQGDLTQDIVDEQILFGEPIDKDGDTLDDEREMEIGTDPNNWDTDGDELGDGDEVIIWKTDPLNPDSDGDSYLDGSEVKNGYNPAGPGKLFEPPIDENVEVVE